MSTRPKPEWTKKDDDMYWGPCGFVITLQDGFACVRIGGPIIQTCQTLASAKSYVRSFIDQCATHAAERRKPAAKK